MIPLRDVIPSRTTPVGHAGPRRPECGRLHPRGDAAARRLRVFRHGVRPGAGRSSPGCRSSRRCSCTPAGCTWARTCSASGSSATTSKIGWVTAASSRSTCWRAWRRRCSRRWPIPTSPLPLVGASGAIAGVMGAYLFMFPHSRIHVLIFLIFYIDIVEIPAPIFLGVWFVMQIRRRRRAPGAGGDGRRGLLGARRRLRHGRRGVVPVPPARSGPGPTGGVKR